MHQTNSLCCNNKKVFSVNRQDFQRLYCLKLQNNSKLGHKSGQKGFTFDLFHLIFVAKRLLLTKLVILLSLFEHSKQLLRALLGYDFSASADWNIYDPAGNVLNRRICLVCTQEGLQGLFSWKWRTFFSTFYTAKIVSDGFLGFLSKCFCQNVTVDFNSISWTGQKQHSTFFKPHASLKTIIPRQIIDSSCKLVSFSPILGYHNFSFLRWHKLET